MKRIYLIALLLVAFGAQAQYRPDPPDPQGGDAAAESDSEAFAAATADAIAGDAEALSSIVINDTRPSVQTFVGGASTYSVTNSTAACLVTGSKWWHRSQSWAGLWAAGAKQTVDEECVTRLQAELDRAYGLRLIGLIDDPAITRSWACEQLGMECEVEEILAPPMFTGEECDERDRRQDEVCWSQVVK